MEYVLGIDSGGTSYRVRAADLSGKELGYHVGVPANLHYLDKTEFLERVNSSLDQCLNQFSGKREDARYLVCGTTGLDGETDQRLLMEYYAALSGITCPLKIINDAQLAHYAVTGGKGILIISGTGSIAFGVNQFGVEARAGGWPLSIFGDEGSGIWVTKMGLRHFARFLDGAAASGPMIEKIISGLGIRTREDLIRAAVEGGKNPAGFPQLGKLVNEAANEGDCHAMEILTGAAEELVHIVDDIVYALNLEDAEADFPIGVWGSNIVKSEIVLDHFTKLVHLKYPGARILLPKKEAIEGAIEMALELLELSS